jgi:LysR family hydrogen peroxide-inducible transcriptional activator
MITLKQLRYLIALAEHRHFGRAAEVCAVSQPALSMQIREIEKFLGAALFERRRNDVALTEIGQEVTYRAERILAASRDLIDVARHQGRILAGGLQLGVIPTLAPYVLPKILPLLHRRHPALRIDLHETQTRVLLDELVRGSLDVVMLALPVHEPDLASMKLFDDPFLLAVPASDPRPETAQVLTEDIDPARLILLEEGHCLRDQALAYCASDRRSTTTGFGATSLATVMQMVANGYGITLLPQVAADVEIRDERVKFLRFAPPLPGRAIGLVWRQTSPRTVDFVALGQAITDALGFSGDVAKSSATQSTNGKGLGQPR